MSCSVCGEAGHSTSWHTIPNNGTCNRCSVYKKSAVLFPCVWKGVRYEEGHDFSDRYVPARSLEESKTEPWEYLETADGHYARHKDGMVFQAPNRIQAAQLVRFLNSYVFRLADAEARVKLLERHFHAFEIAGQPTPRCPRCGNEDGTLGTENVYFICSHCVAATGRSEQYWTPDNSPDRDWLVSAKASPWWRPRNVKHLLEAAERDRDMYRLTHEVTAPSLRRRAEAAEAALSEARAALEFYALRERYLHDDGECSDVCRDEGDIARAALSRPANETVCDHDWAVVGNGGPNQNQPVEWMGKWIEWCTKCPALRWYYLYIEQHKYETPS